MSYNIIYNKQFVKLRKTREIIPMLLSGSNNCYEIGRGGRNGRRTRDWESSRYYNRKGKISEKPEIILKHLDADLREYIRNHRGDSEATPADIRNRFGYYASLVVGSGHCAGTSWDKWRSQFTNGIKQALTIEELDKLGVHLCFSAYCTSPNGYPSSVSLTTERQYFSELKKWREWQNQSKSGFYLTFSPSNTDAVLERLHASKRKTPKEKVRVEQDHYFVLTDGYSGLIKYTSRGYRYGYNKESGKRFRAEKDAEKYRQQLLSNKRYKADIWKVERIDRPCSFFLAS
jgi:hypothetical protein